MDFLSPLAKLTVLLVAPFLLLVPANAQAACDPTLELNYGLCDDHPDAGVILDNPAVYLVFWGWGTIPGSPGEGTACSDPSPESPTDWIDSCPADTLGERAILEGMFVNNFQSWTAPPEVVGNFGFDGSVPESEALAPGSLGLSGTRWINTVSQYTGRSLTDPDGPFVNISNFFNLGAAPLYDTYNPFPTGVPSDAQEAAEVAWALGQFGYSVINSNVNAVIILAYPPGSTLPGLGGEHEWIAGWTNNIPFIVLAYGSDSAAAFHELAESLTNTLADSSQGAWYNPASNSEVADVCGSYTDWLADGGIVDSSGPPQIAVPLQMTSAATPTTYSIPQLFSNVGNYYFYDVGGACVYARATEADVFQFCGDAEFTFLCHQTVHMIPDFDYDDSYEIMYSNYYGPSGNRMGVHCGLQCAG